jgi:iron complex transport system ATP-binding protein
MTGASLGGPPADRTSVPDAVRRATPGVHFNHVAVTYPRAATPALAGVTLHAQPARVTAVVGPNGSGKSTLVRALLRRVPLTSGEILIGDTSLQSLSTREFAQRVAVVPQREEVQMPLPVREFVALGRHVHLGAFTPLRSHDVAVIEQSLALAGMAHLASRRTDTLSGGEWQRVRIARALAQEASVLVLDEPTTFLDIAHEMAVFELLDALASEGRTVLLVSHQLNLVARFASHIVLLHAGQVAASGTATEVMRGDVLERVYEWPLVVTRDPAVGAPALLPLRGGPRGRRA